MYIYIYIYIYVYVYIYALPPSSLCPPFLPFPAAREGNGGKKVMVFRGLPQGLKDAR